MLNFNTNSDDLDASPLPKGSAEKSPELKFEEYAVAEDLQLEGLEENPGSAVTLA